MSDFMNTMFGPLSGEYCAYFYFLSIFAFFLFAVTVLGGFYTGIMKGKGGMYYISIVGASLVYFITYFVNRLMFSVCSKSL